jgi:endonuclease-8
MALLLLFSTLMEGPSLVIAREEMSPAMGELVLKVQGNSHLPIDKLEGQTLVDIGTWGKHLLLFFTEFTVKIHFLMWGSYRVNDPKEERKPRLALILKSIKIYFYSCSIQFLEQDLEDLYDWSADIMSPAWNEKKALKKIKLKPNEMISDILLDQSIFSGVGNIIKNEVLFICRLQPERKVQTLSLAKLRFLIRETHKYAWNFYYWKKAYELKKHWQIMRKKNCPICQNKVTRKLTGKRERLSHFCKVCQS